MKIVIETDIEFGSTVAGEWLAVDMEKMPNVARVELLQYGCRRKFNDGVSPDGKLTPKEVKLQLARKRLEAFYAGNVTRSRGGDGEPEINRFIRAVVARNMSAESRVAYKALKDDPANVEDRDLAKAREAFKWDLYENASDESRAKIEKAAEIDLATHKKRNANLNVDGLSL